MLALVFDFDNTLTVKRARKPKVLDYAYLKDLFGSDDRILMVVRYLRKFRDFPIFICSGNDTDLITSIFEELHALGFDVQVPTIVGNTDDKATFVNGLKYERVIFIDDDKSNYEGVTVETISISGPMEEADFQKIQTSSGGSPSTPKRNRFSVSPQRSEHNVSVW